MASALEDGYGGNQLIGGVTLADRTVPTKVLKELDHSKHDENNRPIRPELPENPEDVKVRQVLNQEQQSDSDQDQRTGQRPGLGADIHFLTPCESLSLVYLPFIPMINNENASEMFPSISHWARCRLCYNATGHLEDS